MRRVGRTSFSLLRGSASESGSGSGSGSGRIESESDLVEDRSRAAPAVFDTARPSARLPVEAAGPENLRIWLHGVDGCLDDLELPSGSRFPDPRDRVDQVDDPNSCADRAARAGTDRSLSSTTSTTRSDPVVRHTVARRDG